PRTRLTHFPYTTLFRPKLFEKYGSPLVLKEPSTSFSMRVEKVQTPAEFMKVAKRFIKLSDRIVAQQYVESRYDWRVGVLDGEFRSEEHTSELQSRENLV